MLHTSRLVAKNGNPWWVTYGEDASLAEVQINLKTGNILVGSGLDFINSEQFTIDEFLESEDKQKRVLFHHPQEVLDEILKACHEKRSSKKS